MPLTRVKQNYQVTIPAKVRQQLYIELGDVFEATIQNGSIVLTPKVVVVMDKKSAHETPKEKSPRSKKSP